MYSGLGLVLQYFLPVHISHFMHVNIVKCLLTWSKNSRSQATWFSISELYAKKVEVLSCHMDFVGVLTNVLCNDAHGRVLY